VFFGARPGGSDLTTQGSPAEYSFCCAENVEATPWQPLHEELGFSNQTTVTVLRCEGPRNVMDSLSRNAEGILESVADTLTGIAANSSFLPAAQSVVFLSPDHAKIVADCGWTKHDTQMFLFERARLPKDLLLRRGVMPHWPAWFDELEEVPVALKPEDFLVVVAGGGGPHSAVAIPWGESIGATVCAADAEH
jgi:hypothetical protein